MATSSSKTSRRLMKIGSKVMKRFSSQQLTKRRSDGKGSILFDSDFYQLQLLDIGLSTNDPWKHYCREGFRLGLNPHPFFDNDFYRQRYFPGEQYDHVVPLQHYVQHAGSNYETHPLSNMAEWVLQMSPAQDKERAAGSLTWLEYFLNKNLFELQAASRELAATYQPKIVREKSVEPAGNDLVAVTAVEPEFDFSQPPSIFDAEYYLESYPDIAKAQMDPWKHYCDHGFRENRNPNPVFNTAYYKSVHLVDQPDTNPVIHYLKGDTLRLSTHPLLDAPLYFSQVDLAERQFRALGISLLDYFLRCNRKDGISPSPFFSCKKYLKQNQDLSAVVTSPLYHYLRYGQKKGRVAPIDIDLVKVLKFRTDAELEALSFAKIANRQFIVDVANLPEQPTILMVSHEASMTGAPLIAIKIAESLQARLGVNIVNVVIREGQVLNRFQDIGPTLSLEGATPSNRPHLFHAKMNLLAELAEHANIIGAIVNSAESRYVLPTLKKAGIPSLSLVHENAYAYAPGKFDDIAKLSDRIVFPSEYTRKAALARTEFPPTSTETLPQGLLKEELLELESSDPTASIRKKHGIPADAIFVLTCGTMDGRKGLDLFVSTAIIALSKFPTDKLYFGWLGGPGHRSVLDQYYWLERDLRAAGISSNVKLLGQTDDVGPYLQACDMLYLSSRMDPFPCVVNEAMAVEKPVVLFENASGCVPLIENKGGVVVPYGNVALAAKAIEDLSVYPELRKQMGKRNREYVAENMNFDNYVSKVLDSLVSAMNQPEYEVAGTDAFEELQSRMQTNHSKIVFTLPSWKISGVNTFVENLIKQLRERGYDAYILFTTRHPSLVEQERMPSVPYRFLSATTLPVEERKQRVAEYLKRNSPCVFVPNFDYTSSSISHELPDNVGVLGVLHSDDDEHYLHGYRMGHYWDAIVAVSETIKQRFLDLNPAFEQRLEVIRYGIPVEDAPVSRRPTSMSSRCLRLIYTGRIVQPQKRIFDFLELIDRLSTTGIEFEFTFVGSGLDEVAFLDRLQPWIDKGVARYLGDCSPDKVAEELKKHDALVLMSEFEGLPLSLLEAMAHRCVPVVTDIPSGIGEVLVHSENGMLSPFGDIGAMVDNIVHLYENRCQLEELADKSFETLSRYKLTVGQMADQYCEILDGMFKKIGADSPGEVVPLNNSFVSSALKDVA